MEILIGLFWLGLLMAAGLFIFNLGLTIVMTIIGVIVAGGIAIYEKIRGLVNKK